jgi:hypothetical protein
MQAPRPSQSQPLQSQACPRACPFFGMHATAPAARSLAVQAASGKIKARPDKCTAAMHRRRAVHECLPCDQRRSCFCCLLHCFQAMPAKLKSTGPAPHMRTVAAQVAAGPVERWASFGCRAASRARRRPKQSLRLAPKRAPQSIRRMGSGRALPRRLARAGDEPRGAHACRPDRPAKYPREPGATSPSSRAACLAAVCRCAAAGRSAGRQPRRTLAPGTPSASRPHPATPARRRTPARPAAAARRPAARPPRGTGRARAARTPRAGAPRSRRRTPG